ncbi:hypothetical protein QOZ80_2AG0121020 [Eleusine coracana subsp. coracana]|nr:hypothetical protein QOZ80_2AG0121020 [Eleusine coracana subsp. coracana]
MEVLCKMMGDLRVMSTMERASTDESHKSERLFGKKPVIVEVDKSSVDTIADSEDEAYEAIDLEDVDREEELELNILPPEVRRSRGRPKTTRLVSIAESACMSQNKIGVNNNSKEAREPQIGYYKSCGNTGHIRATCGRESSYKRKK